MRVLRYDTIDSTNGEARRLAEAGERGPLWVLSACQTGGRGRLGRTWVSEPGNLYCTHLFAIGGDARVASRVSFVASLAVLDVARALLGSGEGLGLKWPNDVLLGGAKFCGILPEAIAHTAYGGTVVGVGIGINLAHAPEGMSYPVTALGKDFGIEDAFAKLRWAIESRLALWDHGRNFEAIRADWERHAIGIGEPAETASGDSGMFEGIAEDGALILRLATGGSRRIHSGEVRFAAIERSRRTG